ncbi:MAG: hypothetical protein QM756_26010 [Polyangiaceae bacterium]
MMEDFEADASLTDWVFSNGPEFPGAKGALTRGSGHAGAGAHLEYDLTGGGNYVSATRTFVTPISPKGLAFWVKQPPRSQAKLRLYDSSGQTLEYTVPRTLEAFDASAWFRVVLDVFQPSGHYGGANDGAPHLPLTGMSILAIPEFEVVGSPTGAIDVDEIAVVESYRSALSPAGFDLVPAPPGASDLSQEFRSQHPSNQGRPRARQRTRRWLRRRAHGRWLERHRGQCGRVRLLALR